MDGRIEFVVKDGTGLTTPSTELPFFFRISLSVKDMQRFPACGSRR